MHIYFQRDARQDFWTFGLNIRAKDNQVHVHKSKEEVKDQESIQSSITPNPGEHIGQ